MDVQQAIAALNRSLSLEYAGVIQYLQHSFLVQEPLREVYADFFRDSSQSCRDHARQLGEMLVGLAGAYSTPKLPPIPGESCHRFHGKTATDSTRKLPLIPGESCH